VIPTVFSAELKPLFETQAWSAVRADSQQDLNKRAIKAKIMGEISAEDFPTFKESMDTEMKAIAAQWNFWIKKALR